ncbi:MAG: hypothetical protein ACREYC_00130, partial [Gammaproteobacteria bacterium]
EKARLCFALRFKRYLFETDTVYPYTGWLRIKSTSINCFPAQSKKAGFLPYFMGQSLQVIDPCPHVPVRAGTAN